MVVALIIPAYNPDERLITFAEELKKAAPEMRLMIVDDGSGAGHAEVFHKLKYTCRAMVCRHPRRYGRGESLKTGIQYLRKNCPGCTGYIMVDMQKPYGVSEIMQVLESMKNNRDSLIVCESPRDGKPVSRGIICWFAGTRNKGLYEIRISGIHTGLLGIPNKFADLCLDIAGDKKEFELCFLLKAFDRGISSARIILPEKTGEKDNLAQRLKKKAASGLTLVKYIWSI